MNFLKVVILAISFIPLPLLADTLKDEADLQPFADKVMQSVEKGDLTKAFSLVKPYAIIPESEFDSAALASKSQREQYGNRYGKTVGYEFISKKKIGNSLVRLNYIEKAEKNALPWNFYFYKSANGWILNSFSWNDQAAQLFFLE